MLTSSKLSRVLAAGTLVLLAISMFSAHKAYAEDTRVVRFAELEIDPQHLAEYEAALREHIAAAIKLEPGVLSLCAASVEGHPEQVRVFEIYASQAAYESHLQSPHFKRYKAVTKDWVKSLKLIETTPIMLGTK